MAPNPITYVKSSAGATTTKNDTVVESPEYPRRAAAVNNGNAANNGTARTGKGDIGRKLHLSTLSSAIAECEGWNKRTSIARRTNNPGNLRKIGDKGKTPSGFAIYSTVDKGFEALGQTIVHYIKLDMTLQKMMEYYAPSLDGNNPYSHADCIAKKAGINKHTKLKDIIDYE